MTGDWAGYGSNGEELRAPFAVLHPTENPQQVLSYVAISAAGFVEGKYHVQTFWDNGVDNHGFLALKNAQGEWVESEGVGSVSFGYDAKTGTPQWGCKYKEFIFDIGMEDMEGAALFGDFVGDGEYIEGKWSLLIQMDADSALSAEDEAMVLRMHDDLNAS